MPTGEIMSDYLLTTEKDRKEMLAAIGAKNIDELYRDIPSNLRAKKLNLNDGVSQQEAGEYMRSLSEQNKVYKCILRGAGSYNHYIPPVVRSLKNRSEFVTAYTPYQAEISQGILQSIFEYQSYICRLTGMDVSNASHYCGATAAAEAILMSVEKDRNNVIISDSINPNTLEVIKTYLNRRDVVINILHFENGVFDASALSKRIDSSVCAVYVEQPNYFGLLEDVEEIASIAHSGGAKLVCSCNPVSLAILKSPAECGADIAVGEAQPLGLEMSFGGPYLGFVACKEKYVRKMPGRIVGKTIDLDGNDAYVLTLQAREQHIRREKATSNICSNQAHCALTASIYLSAMGRDGLKEVASTCLSNAHYLLKELTAIEGVTKIYSGEFFHEFVTKCSKVDEILCALEKENILGGLKIADEEILWCATEMCKKGDLDRTVEIVREVLK